LVDFWRLSSRAFGVVITCRGHDKERTVHSAVAEFERIVAERDGVFTIFADLREMTGYETEAREAWQVAFANHSQRVDSLVLVGAQTALIRMGAAAIGAFAGIPVRFVASWSELPQAPIA
jgi:hypothetical protein